MNAKMAKKLRRIALGAVVAAEETGAAPVPKQAYKTSAKGTVILDQRSWKSAYKGLKKHVS